jgi:hypothetical protein
MNYKILITLIFLLLALTTWSADQKEKKSDDKAQLMLPNQAEGIVYTLPRTIISVKVKLLKESFRPGPYALFAEKYLGHSGVKTTNSENWKMVDMKVACIGEADPDAVYKTFGPTASLVSLNADGSLAGVNNQTAVETATPFGNPVIAYSEIPGVVFSDLSSDDQYDLEVNAETGEEKMKLKSLEEKAREAADYLFRIRKKRAYTILSPSDVVPEDGKGYEVFVQQADKIDKEYVSLFLGKSFKSEHEFTVTFTPGKESVKSEVLFRFSEEKGMLPKSDISGKPVTIELVKDQRQYSSIESIYQPSGPNSGRSGLFYRIPVNANLTIAEGYNTLYSGRFPVAQFGFISPVPELLINENTSIHFDPLTGAIRYCEKTK